MRVKMKTGPPNGQRLRLLVLRRRRCFANCSMSCRRRPAETETTRPSRRHHGKFFHDAWFQVAVFDGLKTTTSPGSKRRVRQLETEPRCRRRDFLFPRAAERLPIDYVLSPRLDPHP